MSLFIKLVPGVIDDVDQESLFFSYKLLISFMNHVRCLLTRCCSNFATGATPSNATITLLLGFTNLIYDSIFLHVSSINVFSRVSKFDIFSFLKILYASYIIELLSK